MNTRILNRVASVIVCLGVVITASSFAADTNAAPESFKASIAGFLDPPQKTQAVRVTPTDKQWREFRRALDNVSIWQWRTNYPDPGFYDGTQWSLQIQYRDRTLKTEGSNNFPGRAGKPNGNPTMTKAFLAYSAAVKRLLDGKEFQ